MSLEEHASRDLLAPEKFLVASHRRDSRRYAWNRALIVRAHCKSAIPGQALRAILFPATQLVRSPADRWTIGHGDPGHLARARCTWPC